MKKFLSKLMLSVGLSGSLLAGPTALYENFGNNDFGGTPPQIDALAFANYGVFDVGFTSLPFDFQNTINFTNTGTMGGQPGYIFDTSSSFGPRRPALNFLNATGARIESTDVTVSGIGGSFNSASYLLVTATNVANQGILTAGAGGLMRLTGSKVDLSSGGLQTLPLAPGSGFGPFITASNFYPDIGIYDEFWGGITNQFMDTSQILQSFGAVSPPSSVTNANGNSFLTQVAAIFPEYSLFTQKLSETNYIVQAVFVGLADSSFQTEIVFAPSSEFGNPFKTVVVRVSEVSSNVVTAGTTSENLFLLDQLGASTNYAMLTNLSTFPNYTFRPANYELSRGAPNAYFNGIPGNDVLTNLNIFSDASYSNVVVTNLYSAYSAFIDSQPVVVPNVPGATVTNLPGRIEVRSDTLDLNGARMRGNTFVYLDTKHLAGSSNAIVDSPNVSFNLASTNGTLSLQNMIPDSVIRLNGILTCWSGLWSNQSGTITTNIGPDPNDPTNTVTNVVTNIVDIGFHVLIVDGSGLIGQQPVAVHAAALKATNVLLGNNLQVVDSFLVDAANLTLSSQVGLSGGTRDWTAATAPSLMNFTNTGTLSIENDAFFGTDRVRSYSNLVNRGQMSMASLYVRSRYFQNSGTISDSRRFQLEAIDAAFQGGTINSGSDVFLNTDTAKFLNHTLTTTRGLHFSVTNSLADSGAGASNVWTCQNGFEMLRKPSEGDLLGTTLVTVAPQFATVRNTWAAVNQGATAAGYSNNFAIGRLAMGVNAPVQGRQIFGGLGANRALYVDFLELRGPLTNALANYVAIDSNFVIYFADSNVSPEELNGKLGGRLVWVPTFAGPNSSVDILRLNGQTEKMNRTLRNSTTIDSDGDGVANAYDVYPLDPEAWNGVSALPVAGGGVRFSWAAAAGARYQIESTTNLSTPNWQAVPGYSDLVVTNGVIAVTDTNLTSGAAQRYYRVRYNP